MVVADKALMCDNSVKDLTVVSIRAKQLKTMLDGADNESVKLVIGTELKSILTLGRMIQMWRVENCREA